MDERDQERQLIDAQTEGTGRLRAGVERARAGLERVRLGGGDAAWLLRDKARGGSEDAAWFLRRRVAWPVEDGLTALGTRGRIGVFGGGGIALAGVIAAILVAGSGGSGADTSTTAALAVRPAPAPAPAVAPTAKPKQKAAKPAGPTLHGSPPDFAPAEKVKAGVGDGKALGATQKSSGAGEAPAPRGSTASASEGSTGGGSAASAGGESAATAKIGSTPAATASAAAQADSLKTSGGNAAGAEAGAAAGTEQSGELDGPPAPKAAKRVARRFAEAFVVYEVQGVDGKVRKAFHSTGTRQLARSLLRRPPRQPANVKVPKAKVVNVVAGPSKGKVYEVSVSLLRVGVTSELRLEMEQGVGKKWEVTNVLG